MKLSLLPIALALVPASGAFVAPFQHHHRVSFVVRNGQAPSKKQQIERVDDTVVAHVDDKIKQEFESDENSPAKMEAAAKGHADEQNKEKNENTEKKEKRFDPLSLWTDHSGKF